MIESYIESNRGRPLIACVLDSYDLFSAVAFCCSLRSKIESDAYPTLVMRPDSGDPMEIIPAILEIMESSGLAHDTVNGYRVFRKYRILWGDGINPATIRAILGLAMSLGYSPANFAFGSGGDLMQKIDRDTCRFAIKCCAIRLEDGTERPVFKKPAQDPDKISKKGFQPMPDDYLRFRDGQLFNAVTFDQVRGAI
jgi:nicotinamide phosphoribosyltransferase